MMKVYIILPAAVCIFFAKTYSISKFLKVSNKIADQSSVCIFTLCLARQLNYSPQPHKEVTISTTYTCVRDKIVNVFLASYVIVLIENVINVELSCQLLPASEF